MCSQGWLVEGLSVDYEAQVRNIHCVIIDTDKAAMQNNCPEDVKKREAFCDRTQ